MSDESSSLAGMLVLRLSSGRNRHVKSKCLIKATLTEIISEIYSYCLKLQLKRVHAVCTGAEYC